MLQKRGRCQKGRKNVEDCHHVNPLQQSQNLMIVLGIRGGLALESQSQDQQPSQQMSVSTVEDLATGKETVQSCKEVEQTSEKDKSKRFSNFEFLKEGLDPNTSELDSNSVKGRLKKNLPFWEQLGANKFIVDVIRQGYQLPFSKIPCTKQFENNKSALLHREFVEDSIDELLLSGSIIETVTLPTVVSPLSVNVRQSGKKRLILDLRYVNDHLVKDNIKFDDWRSFSQFVHPGSFVYKFDLKKGYHHVDIFPEHQTYLGFSWERNGITKYYVFTVLPFGLSTAPALFTKLLRPLVAVWHQRGINISVYLDDGAGIEYSYSKAIVASTNTRLLLQKCGFVINQEKSEWEPQKVFTWLGVTLNLVENTYKISSERIASIFSTIEILLKSPQTTARSLSRFTGKLVSTKFVLSNIVRLKTRFLYKTIDEQSSWDRKLNILNYPEAHKEILFWKDNLYNLNVRSVIKSNSVREQIFSDASSTGVGAVWLVENKIAPSLVCHKMFDNDEILRSSTWRELEAIRFALEAFGEKLSFKSVTWMTDNQAATYVSRSGSSKLDLQNLALKIYDLTRQFKIDFEITWISRDSNKNADLISKIVDPDDWEITDYLFNIIDAKWGPFTVDRFANFNNNKVKRFNSKYLVPGTEAVDAFSQDWSYEINLLVPPVSQIIRVISYLKLSRNFKGVLVVPFWPAAPFWSLLRNNNGYQDFVKDFLVFNDTKNILKQGIFDQSLLGSPAYKGGIVAFKINY